MNRRVQLICRDGARPESMDAKECEDCEAGDAGAGEGATPDRTCGYTRRMITNHAISKRR
jgi:hypothetical protein